MTVAEIGAFVACVLVGWLARVQPGSPLPRPLRQVVRWTVAPLARLLLLSVGFWRIRTVGPEKFCQSTRLVVSNHASIFDGFVLTALCGAPSFLARTEGLARMPIYSHILRAMQLVFVDRSDPKSRRQAAVEVTKRLQSPHAAEFPHLVVFPEGTTNDGSAPLLPFRKGAFVAGVPCQPVIIRYPGLDFGPHAMTILQELLLVVRIMLRPAVPCEVTFLPEYVPTDEEKANPTIYADNVRLMMLGELVKPVHAHSE
eukprot:INCI19284.2.p1 GENE.INCI19284.2~~INCI19284.2.p1  ORF type:complete len:297 (+),score=18.03 INCI19284.2:124-891(+)